MGLGYHFDPEFSFVIITVFSRKYSVEIHQNSKEFGKSRFFMEAVFWDLFGKYYYFGFLYHIEERRFWGARERFF